MNGKSITLRQVSSCDTVAFVARTLLISVWVLLSAILIYARLSGRKPEESPAEIAFIMATFSAAFLAVILSRRAKVKRLVREGTPVRGAVSSCSRYQFFVNIGVDFTWRGQPVKRVIQLPAVSAATSIMSRGHVTLMVDPEHPQRMVIRELYIGG